MLEYITKLSPDLKEPCITYTDTDSLHLHGKYLELFGDSYVEKEKSKLGLLCSDIDDEGIIIKEINLAPKCYAYVYINKNGEIGITNKTKGIPTKYLEFDDFIKNEEEHVSIKKTMEGRLKKVNYNPTKEMTEKGINYFSIISCDMERTFNQTMWKGAKLNGNQYIPEGHWLYDLPKL